MCGSHHVVHDGSHIRRFVSVPIGLNKTYLDMHVQRVICHDCGCIQQEKIDFAKGKRRHTQAFANMVLGLSRFATIQDISWFLQVSWDVVRNIQMEFLQAEYGNDIFDHQHAAAYCGFSPIKAVAVLFNTLTIIARIELFPLLMKFANTLMAHQTGILAWYDYHISTAKLEGINNKIKTMKRMAYGYRDDKFFELKILSMHDKNYAFVGLTI